MQILLVLSLTRCIIQLRLTEGSVVRSQKISIIPETKDSFSNCPASNFIELESLRHMMIQYASKAL